VTVTTNVGEPSGVVAVVLTVRVELYELPEIE
jgi:hypothetical protein